MVNVHPLHICMSFFITGTATTALVLQDYPSISHINSVAQANSFILLFAVVEAYKDVYQVHRKDE